VIPGWRQLRYAARSLARSPALAATLLLSIALGIGSNAAVAGFVRGLVDRELPLPHAGRLVSLFGRDAQDGHAPLSRDVLRALNTEAHFEKLGAVRETRGQVVIGGRSSIRTVATAIADAPELLGLTGGPGVVISHALWLQEFEGRSAVESPVLVDGRDARISAVAPEWLTGLHLGSPIDVWVTELDPDLGSAEDPSRTWWALARLRDGTSAFDVQGTVNTTRSGDDAIAVLPYSGMRPEAAGAMARVGTLLTAAAFAVFVIATVNVATFLLSRGSGRSRETALRVALGGSRRQLAGQLLADALVLSLAGGAAGALCAFWTAGIIPSLFFEQDAEALVFAPDLTAILLAAFGCMTVMVACGLLPMLEVRHDDPAAVLRRESSGPSRVVQRLRSSFVVLQMACCCVLVIAAGTLLAGFRSALHAARGDRTGSTILATLTSGATVSRPDLALAYYASALREADSIGGITGTALVGTAPGGRVSAQSVRFEAPPAAFEHVTMDVAVFTPDSLDELEMPLPAGRLFGGADRPGGCKAVVVTAEAAETLFDNDAVGRSLIDPAGERVQIVGVVRLRKAQDARPRAPTVFYYGEQSGPPRDQLGPAVFKVPVRGPRVVGVLDTLVVSPGYFELAGSAVLEGGLPGEAQAPGGCRTAVINREASQLYFGGSAAGGAVIDAAGVRTEITGVVVSSALRDSGRAPHPTLFLPIAENATLLPVTRDLRMKVTMLVQTTAPADDMLEELPRRLAAVEGGGEPPVLMTLEEQLVRSGLAGDRIAVLLVGVLAAIGLALGIFGLYGAMSEAGRRRRREFAVRVALGARGFQLVRQVLAHGLRLAAAGLVTGLVLALPVKGWVGTIARDAPLPPWVWIATPLVLLLAVMLASVLPARRAVAVNPLSIMRDE
jgi:putative ABC transport system permease protein